jgi:hypothetical protein
MHTNSPYRLVAPEPRALGLGIAGATLRAVAVAAALACSAGASLAGDATVKVTSFTVSAAEFSGNFAFAMDPFQSYNLSALEAGGALGGMTDNFAADDWNLGLNRLAQTANTKATGNTVQFTDVTTQLTTAGFNLFAQATPLYSPPALPNSANASALQSGTFVLFDGNGARTGGTITFDLFYDMSVATPGSTATNYSQTQLNVLRSSDATDTVSFADGLLSTGLSGGTGAITSGHYSWTYTLAADEAAYYTLSGSAIAFASVAAIPEPETYALMLLGLAGIGAVARRRRTPAESEAALA